MNIGGFDGGSRHVPVDLRHRFSKNTRPQSRAATHLRRRFSKNGISNQCGHPLETPFFKNGISNYYMFLNICEHRWLSRWVPACDGEESHLIFERSPFLPSLRSWGFPIFRPFGFKRPSRDLLTETLRPRLKCQPVLPRYCLLTLDFVTLVEIICCFVGPMR